MVPVQRYKNEDPSVTQIINVFEKPGLYRWYAKYGWNHCESIKRTAGDAGTRVHDSICKFIRGDSFSNACRELSHEQIQVFSRFTSWIREEGIKAVEQELTLHSKGHQFNGTFDILCTRKRSKKLWLGDWKTSKSLHKKEHLYQLGGYSQLILENLGKDVQLGFVKRIGLDLSTNEMETDELGLYRTKFLRLRETYRDWTGK